MLSKNNRHLQEQRMIDSKQRFSIRKYSFGAASVLLGLSFMTYAGGNPVSADTTDQPATVTEPKTTSTDKASTAQITAASASTATSEASSTATSEAAKRTSEAVSSTATSESAEAETTQNSETASKETVTSEAAKESTATSEASKTSTATSEASEKASTATNESTTPATATSEENSQEQTATSETADANALTASKVAKPSALKSVKLVALKSAKFAALKSAPATTAITDDSLSSSGEITTAGKDKGLTDSDVTPGMGDPDGASLVIDNSKIPNGYKADPTEGRYTFGILSLGPVEKNGSDLTSYNEKYNTNYYIRMSTASQGTNGTYDDTVYIQLVDANDNHKVLWEASAKPGDVNQTITALKPTKNNPFQYSYKEATVSGVTSKIIDFNASPIDANNGTMYSINVYENGSSAGNSATTDVAFKYPATSTLETRYIAKDAAGNETILATYDETGRVGYTYTASGSRNFVGYDKVPAPSSTTGVLQASYKVGDTYFGGAAPISDQLQMAVVRVVADSDGTATVQLRVATKDASTSNINDTSVWKTVFTSEELKPGEVSKTGDNLINGTNYTKGAVALSKTSNLYSKIKSVGFTEEQLTGLIGSNWSIINKLAPGQSSVNYYYAPQGQVRVNYVTSDGKTLQAPITVYENSSAGTSYDAANYRPATITVNGKTYHWVKSDKSLGTPGTTTINGYTYYVTPSDETGKISSNTVSDVYYVYKLLTYRTEVETKDVTRTIEYYDSVTNKPIPDSLEKTVTQTATLKRNKIYDDQNNFIGYGTISADGSSYTIDDSWTVDAQTWTQQDSADLSGYGYTAPDRPSVAAVTVDGNTTTVTEMVRYGHQTQTITPNDPNPVTPGKPINPKGDVNYPDGVSKDDLTSTVKRTIKYVDEDGKAVDGSPDGTSRYEQTAEFTRTAIVDKVTGKILGYDTDGDGEVDTTKADQAWTPTKKTLLEAQSKDPKLLGYDEVDTPVVPDLVVTPGQGDSEVTVKYGKITYTLKDVETKTVTRTINYVDSVTGKAIPSELEPSVTQTATLTRSVIYDNKGNKIGYGTVSADGKSYTLNDSYKVTGSWDEKKSADLSSHGYTAPDKETVAAVNVDGSTKDTVVTVYYGHQTVPVTPEDPKNPGDPIIPGGNVTYPKGLTEKDLKDTVTRTIKYVDAKGNLVNGSPDGTSRYDQTAEFTRTAIVDKVTGKILGYDTDGDGEVDTTKADQAWTPTKKTLLEAQSKDPKLLGYDEVDTPVVPDLVVTPGQGDTTVTVTYNNITYTLKDEETKTVTRTINYVDSVTGKAIPSELEPSVTQTATLTRSVIYDSKGNKIGYGTVSADGKSYTLNDSYKVTGSWDEKKSADLSSHGYTAPDKETVAAVNVDGSTKDTVVTVYYGHQTVPVTPKDPKNPGDPIIPGGNITYPDGLTEKDLKDTVTRTIEYVDVKGNLVNGSPDGKSSYVQTVTFERTAIVDKVTGKILGYDTNKDGKADTDDPNRAWKPLSADLGEVKSTDPKTLGFDHVDKSVVSKETVVPGQADLNEKVVYSNNPMVVSGTIKYVDDTTGVTLDEDVLPSGEVGSKINYTTADKITYYENKGYDLVSNDFKDGTTTYAKEGNKFEVHLKHKTQTITPNDPNPVTPGNPINPKDPNSPVYGEETDRKNLVKDATQTIHYVGAGDKTPADKKQTQKEAFTRTVTIDKVTGKVLETSAWEGTKTFGFEDTPFVEGYHANKKSEGGLTATPDNPDVKATVTYTPNGKLIPVDEEGVHIKDTDTPTYKTDPNDPTKVVDPTVPEVEGYQPRDNKVGDKVTPKDPAKDTEVVYVKTPETKYGLTEKFVDVDGNELLPSESKGTEYKTGETYDVTKDAKVINGYVLVDTDETTGTFDKSDKTATFIYKKVGKIIPVDKDHNPIPGADTPSYKNDPDDPTKVTPNEPTPTVPGWTTDVPNVTPEDPTKDTPVPYTKNETPAAKYGLTEKFVDENGNDLVPSVSKGTDYKSGDKYDVTKDAKVITGYVLVKTTDTTGTFDKSDKTAVFTYKKLGKIVPVDPKGNPIPGADTPTYKNDPDDPSKVVPNEPTPSVPGYKTDVPKVTPEGPTKDTPVPYTKNETPAAKYGLTEKFVDENGNDLVPSVSKGTDYKSGDKYDVTKDAKVITGYVLVKTTDTTGTFEKSDKTAVFTYKKLGKIVPVDPKGNPIPGADTPTYKNDPDDPSKVVPNEPTPSVPGYKTDVPKVTPEDPTKDTPVPYTKNETPAAKYGLTEKFVDENGNDLVPSVSKGTDYKSGDKYDVTKDAKVITGYVLVKTTDTTGTFTDDNKTAVFTYKKLGKIVPVDPNSNPIPGADTPTYKNDPDDPSKVVPNEPTPSVPGYKTDVPKVTPEDPTKDTPVPYTKNETPAAKYGLTEKFVDENGNDLVPSVSKGTDYKSGDKYDVTKDAKVITGYVLVKTTDTTGTFDKSDKTAVFTYKKLGKIVPVDPKGNPIPGADTPTYKNDPDDPSKVVPNEPTPSVPGYKTNVPKVTPEDPTKDTPVPYTKNETPAAKYGLTEKFVDENGNDLVPSVSKGTDYKSGDKYDVTKDAKVITGYVLVKTTDTTGTFEKSDKTAVFTYKKLGKIVPVDPKGNPIPGADTPTYKNDPDDPSKVVPNEPTPSVPGYKTDVPNVTPEDPTKDTPVPYTKNETPAAKYGLTEKFVDENGNDLVPSESKGTDYKSGDKYDVTKDAKVITGYVLVKTTDTTGTFEKSDKTAVFTYKKLGKIVPVDPNGNPIPGAETPTYKNDPDDPTKVTPNEPTPSLPGYKTNVPNVTPEDPTKDTPVPYTKNETPAAKYGLTEKFVDENGNELVPSESKGTDYKSGDKYDVTKDAKVITGYVLVKTEDTTGTFTDGNKTAVFTYKKLGKIVPVDPKGNPIPGADTPTYKNDPDDPSKVVPNEPTPSVPGYKTDVPNVTPEDPTKDTPVPYTKKTTPETPAAKYGLTEKFVDENGNDLVPSESKGTDYKSGDKYDVTKDAKVITGYVLVKTTDTTGTFGDSDKTAVFTYKKIGKIVPVDKDGNPIPGAETPSYKNDPSDPSKVLPNEPTPDVLGYKTDVPSVTPEDPTKDTPVPYTKSVTPSKPSNNKPGKKGAPSAPTGPTSPTLPGGKKGKTAPATPNATAFSTGSSKQTASLKQNAQAKLPQTGEATDKSRALSVLGLGVIALTALLGLAIDKKRKN